MQLIINCDDFGMRPEINQAVLTAHQAGRLASATLYLDGAALAEAVQIAKTHPALGVGLHLNLDPLLGFDQDGYYGSSLSNVNPEKYRALIQDGPVLERAIRAQFERFQATGLAMSHVDSHHNAHLLPEIFQRVVEIGAEFGVRKLRFRRDYYEDNQTLYDRHQQILQAAGFKTSAHFRDFGRPEALLNLPEGVTELMAHLDAPGPNSQPWCEAQFARLMAPETWTTLTGQEAEIVSYHAL